MLSLANAAAAADLPLKAPAVPDAVFSWTGFYIGGHFGYAAGRADWSATDAGAAAPVLAGSLDLFNQFDAFKGTGSYFFGLQAGYNYVLPSRWLIGFEADASAPNTLAGSQTMTTPIDGQATYDDTVLDFGTARARVGYAFDRFLVYGTGGLAWSYDRLQRTQLAGGSVTAGATETAFLWRWGWAAGAGVEFPVAPNWTAKVEYLATGFGDGRKSFPAAGQSFDSDLSIQSLRVGVNYQLGVDPLKNEAFTKGVPPLDAGDFAVHGQATLVEQYAAPFHAPYAGQNSLASNSGRETFDLDLYVGYRPWKGAEIWVDPEIDQGFGLSGTFGVAGFPSAEAYKVGQNYPYARIPRAFLRQTIDLGGESQKVDAGINQFAGTQTSDRLVITVGKFGVVDIFDKNKYANDPRGDFLNWTLVNTGAFDYAADAWAFTYGGAARMVHRTMDVPRRRVRRPDRSQQHRTRPDLRPVPDGRRNRAPLRFVGPARQGFGDRLPGPRAAGKFSGRDHCRSLGWYDARHRVGANLHRQGRYYRQSGAADHPRRRPVRARRLYARQSGGLCLHRR